MKMEATIIGCSIGLLASTVRCKHMYLGTVAGLLLNSLTHGGMQFWAYASFHTSGFDIDHTIILVLEIPKRGPLFFGGLQVLQSTRGCGCKALAVNHAPIPKTSTPATIGIPAKVAKSQRKNIESQGEAGMYIREVSISSAHTIPCVMSIKFSVYIENPSRPCSNYPLPSLHRTAKGQLASLQP